MLRSVCVREEGRGRGREREREGEGEGERERGREGEKESWVDGLRNDVILCTMCTSCALLSVNMVETCSTP